MRRVLGRQHHGVDADRAVAVVADRHLGLAVRAQVGHQALLADGGEPLGQPVRQPDRQRHQLGGVGAGVAEHQALVAGALRVVVVGSALDPVLVRLVDALGDVGGLRADRDLDAAGVAVEALVGGVVADREHGLADQRGDVGVGLGVHLARDVDQARGHHRLDGDPALRVLPQQVVQDRVRDLVADLVGVPLGDGLRGEQAQVGRAHGAPRWCSAARTGRAAAVGRAASGGCLRRAAVTLAAGPRRPRRRPPPGPSSPGRRWWRCPRA